MHMSLHRRFIGLAGWAMVFVLALVGGVSGAFGFTLSNSFFNVTTGSNGEISSLQLAGDSFATNYVMNATNASQQNTSGHEWLGELMFKYRLGTTTTWSTALTQSSSDVRTQSQSGNTVTVTYQNSTATNGVKNLKVVETYSLVNDYLQWSIAVTNTTTQSMEIGDFGLPLPFNEYWSGGDIIYEQRTVFHSFVGNNGSYITVTRPSGVGPFLLMVPDSTTTAGFEYMDHWRTAERSSAEAAWCQDQAGWSNGLNVFYINSNVIKSTNRGYLPNTSTTLAAGASKTYSFRFYKVASHADVKDHLYNAGLIDVTALPGMMFASDMTAKFDLRTSQSITAVTAQYPSESTLTSLGTQTGGHNLYSFKSTHLGQNNITVTYGSGLTTTLQFYVLEPVGTAIQRHASFMVNSTQWNAPGQVYDKVFDDWLTTTHAKRGNFTGYGGWGDDWGLTHGEFLAEKNAQNPVAAEVTALDNYLGTAVWGPIMAGGTKTTNDYRVHDWLNSTIPPYTDDMNRGYAYPHVYNTFFGMYKIAKKYPNLVTYQQTAVTYLTRAYNILKTQYDGSGVSFNWNTGQMGESSIPEIIAALQTEGLTTQYNDLVSKMATKYNNFKNTTYPYGSEYNYDNTGEEAIYALAQINNDTALKSKINTKVRATRGQQPVWYYYADPVTITGEAWWNFQYTAALQGFALDDWARFQSTTPELDERLSYASKLANVSAINSGQISSNAADLGTVAWTYQSEKGNIANTSFDGAPLVNNWRNMSGEADLGLWGAVRLLSSDIAVDPIFGLYGYGCDVTQSGSNYLITPRDGVFQRLNLITQKLYVALDRDQYTSATLATTKDYVQLSLKNLTPTGTHTTKVTLTGLAINSYDVLLDNVKVGSVTAVNGQNTVVALTLGANSTYDLKLQAGTPPANTAPVVNAGSAAQFTLPPGTINLSGTASDDGLPSGTLTTTWSLVSGPSTATFANAAALNTTATVTAVGTYVFQLSASDGSLSSNSTVTMTVVAQPDVLVYYPFDQSSGTTVTDTSGNGKTGTITGTATWTAGKVNNALALDGSTSYVSVPSGVVSGLTNFTVAGWIKPTSLSNWMRVFDFGSSTTNYMFLTPQSGGGWRFAITTAGNGSEQQLNYSTAPSTGVWTHVAVTLSGNTGTLYVNGLQVAQNTSMTLHPSSLGTTTQNYIGKSQFGDPLFNGAVDEFKIYSRALSASEVSALAGSSGSSSLVAYYKLDETAGTSASDSSGNAKTGTITGTAAWAAGKKNNALTLNGSNTYVSLPSGIVSGLTSFTFAAWIKPAALSNWVRLFDFGTGTTKYMFLTPQSGGGWRFAITTAGNGSEQQLNYATAPSTGVWTHVAVTLTGTTGTLYVNGVQVAQNTAMTLNPSSLGTTTLNYLGKSQYGDPLLNGAIDEVYIYNRALSAAEVNSLFAAP
jgi:hypothetical protein